EPDVFPESLSCARSIPGALSQLGECPPHKIPQSAEAPGMQRRLCLLQLLGQRGVAAIQALVVLVAAREQHAQFLKIALAQSEAGTEALGQRAVDIDRRMGVRSFLHRALPCIKV